MSSHHFRFPAARRSHDDEIADRTREEWLKYAIVYVLSSATFWLFAIFLVLVDLAIFAWQVGRSHTRVVWYYSTPLTAGPPLFVQVIYKDDHRLHILEVFIAGIFLVELLLRAYAFDLKSLVSWLVCKCSECCLFHWCTYHTITPARPLPQHPSARRVCGSPLFFLLVDVHQQPLSRRAFRKVRRTRQKSKSPSHALLPAVLSQTPIACSLSSGCSSYFVGHHACHELYRSPATILGPR